MKAPDHPAPGALRALVFLGALLLFTLEPLIGRLLLPGFGGAFYVWTTTLTFFQAALLLGYLWAYRVAPRIGCAHAALVLSPLVLLPLAVPSTPATSDVAALLRVLATHVGLAAVALSTTAVVSQSMLARSGVASERTTYSLYAISNAGSFAGLVVDVLAVGPLVGLRVWTLLWSALYVVYIALAIVTLVRYAPSPSRALATTALTGGRARVRWVLLALWPSMLLSAVTNKLTLDAGPIPLLWTLPLAVYLLSFVLAFDARDRVPGSIRRLWPHVALVGLYLSLGGDFGSGLAQAVALITLLAVLTIAGHAELYAMRPEAEALGGYYFSTAVGGVLGGAFVALGAPVFFTSLWELTIAIVGMLATVGWLRRTSLMAWVRTAERPAIAVSVLLVLVVVAKLLVGNHAAHLDGVRTLDALRSPYGVYHVLERRDDSGATRELVSGTTRHGRQRVGHNDPLSYYHRAGSLGDAFRVLRSPAGRRRVGVVGLGVGAAAAHLVPGDTLDFDEIDPAVEVLARRWFGFLSATQGTVRVHTGDARAALARRTVRYDLLVIDAFAGDAIPTHLLTREAIALDLARTTPEGLVLVHASNRVHDLRLVVGAIARSLGVPWCWRRRLEGLAAGEDPSMYIALAHDEATLRTLVACGWSMGGVIEHAPWTDDRSDPAGLFVRGLLGR